MDTLLQDVAIGGLGAGGLQLTANLFKTADTFIKGMSSVALSHRQQDLKERQQFDSSYAEKQEAASKRFGGLITGIVFTLITLAAFYGGFYVIINDLPTSVILTKEPWFNLFDIIRIGGGPKAETLEGWVIPDWWGRVVVMMMSALTAIKAAKYK